MSAASNLSALASRRAAWLRSGATLLGVAALIGAGVCALFDRPVGVVICALVAVVGLAGVLLAMGRRLREHEREIRRLAAAVESSGDAIVTIDERHCFSSWNPSATALLGYTAEQAIGQPLAMIIPEDRRDELAQRLECIGRGESVRGWETSRRRDDGELVDVELTVSALHDAGGRAAGVTAIMRDISERRRAERALAESEERFRRSFADSDVGMAIVRPNGDSGDVLEMNDALAQILGYPVDELRARGPMSLVHPDDLDALREEIVAINSGQVGVLRREVRLTTAAGTLIWAAITMSLVRDESGEPLHLVVQVQDVSERRSFEGQLQQLADHDPVTGLFNRRRFEQELGREVATARRYGQGGAVLALDLDHFKFVNDSLGHAAGDELIRVIGELLLRRLRHSDVIARTGGDEFVVILPRADEEEARRTGESLLRELRTDARAARIVGERRVTASIGIALFGHRTPNVSAEALLAEADIAMYDAKEAGRDRLAVYDAKGSRHERMQASLAWVQRIEAALESDRFVLYAQPIVPVADAGDHRYELLLRMLSEAGEVIPPATFLDVAERHGLAGRIDRWVVSHAVGQLAEQQRRGCQVSFEVNLSAASVSDPDMLDFISRLIATAGLDPGRLIFEVTETAAIVNVAQATSFVQGLRDIGCEFAIDDFGAGFASFYYLKHLPFDYLKIDGEFIKGLAESHTNQLVVRSVADIARGLGRRTIAEFVEEASTLELLREYGVDYAQGYFTGRPMPLQDIDFAVEHVPAGGSAQSGRAAPA